jgi:hypothetical protein
MKTKEEVIKHIQLVQETQNEAVQLLRTPNMDTHYESLTHSLANIVIAKAFLTSQLTLIKKGEIK